MTRNQFIDHLKSQGWIQPVESQIEGQIVFTHPEGFLTCICLDEDDYIRIGVRSMGQTEKPVGGSKLSGSLRDVRVINGRLFHHEEEFPLFYDGDRFQSFPKKGERD